MTILSWVGHRHTIWQKYVGSQHYQVSFAAQHWHLVKDSIAGVQGFCVGLLTTRRVPLAETKAT